ncbi:cytochrome P450 [Massariosphaeria phaeospora]|uniref:Cytochrome P450 n=1 Tax=Massariosphaeria phaeospora TaxID=100035 RepID=A0A7C8IJD0_9PLEO|nr:cytochrome P450 [Massariosphaeria phaeospora]
MVLARHGTTREISLLKWSQHVLLEGATRSFFGDALLDLEPNLFESFFQFDDSSWKLPYRIPSILARDVKKAQAITEKALANYFDLPAERRSDASSLVHQVELFMRASRIQSNDIGVLVLMFYWVINANAWKSSFWMIAEIVNNETLRTSILEEVEPHIASVVERSISSTDFATQLQNCPNLVAVYHESLRVTSASTSVRIVTKEARVGPFQLRKGARMIIPYRQMLLDEDTYGAKADEFNYKRFINDPGLSRSPYYKPFGGGTSLCPGRALAQKEILTFVALAIGKFRARRTCGANGKRDGVPRINTRTPCIGIMSPEEGHDVRVVITEPSP